MSKFPQSPHAFGREGLPPRSEYISICRAIRSALSALLAKICNKSEPKLSPNCSQASPTWHQIGPKWFQKRPPGNFWNHVGPIWCHAGAILGRLGASLVIRNFGRNFADCLARFSRPLRVPVNSYVRKRGRSKGGGSHLFDFRPNCYDPLMLRFIDKILFTFGHNPSKNGPKSALRAPNQPRSNASGCRK